MEGDFLAACLAGERKGLAQLDLAVALLVPAQPSQHRRAVHGRHAPILPLNLTFEKRPCLPPIRRPDERDAHGAVVVPLAHGDHAQPVMVRAAAGPLATLELAFVHVAARIRHPAGPVHEAVYNVALVVRARGPLDRARRRLHAGTRRQPRRRRRSCRAWRRPVLRYRVIVWPPRPKVALFVRVRVRLRVGRLGPSKGGLQLALGLSEQSVGYYGRVGHWTEQRHERRSPCTKSNDARRDDAMVQQKGHEARTHQPRCC